MNTTGYVLLGGVALLIVAGTVVAELSHRAHQKERRNKSS